MNPVLATPALVAACILLVGCGLALIVVGLQPVPASTPTFARSPRLSRLVDAVTGRNLPAGPRRSRRVALVVGFTAGLAAWLISGWLLPLLLLPVAAVAVPTLMAPPPSATNIALLEGLEQWIRQIAGLLVASSGIEQSILISVSSAPPAVKPHVQALAARLRAQVPTETALRAFADDLNDATGDLVTSALILGTRRRDRGLADALTQFAASVEEEVRMRRAVEADRAKPRNTVRVVTGISVVVLGAGFLFTDFMDPYRSGVGQPLLLLLLAAYLACLTWLRRLSAGRPTPRFLADSSAGGTSRGVAA